MNDTNLNSQDEVDYIFEEDKGEVSNKIIESNQILEDDDELLKTFIGKNYEKITSSKFNVFGFFFTSLYMFYRKMFFYGLLLFLLSLFVLNIIKNSFVTFVFNLLVGLLVNKIYLFYVNKKIAKIKKQNPSKDINELKSICASKGGTSIGRVFLGFITEFFIAFVILIGMLLLGMGDSFIKLIKFENLNKKEDSQVNISDTSSETNPELIENVTVGSYGCVLSLCTVNITDANNNSSNYILDVTNSDLFTALGGYEKYIKLDIYYIKKENENVINDYKIYLKSTNEDITAITTEEQLREKIGLYNDGLYIDSLTLTKIGSTGFGFKNNESYSYTTYTFLSSDNYEYEMKYIGDTSSLNLVTGNKYIVTFLVNKETTGYEFTIKTIS